MKYPAEKRTGAEHTERNDLPVKRTIKMNGVCSRTVSFDIDGEGRVHNVEFVGGCNGNLKGVAALRACAAASKRPPVPTNLPPRWRRR